MHVYESLHSQHRLHPLLAQKFAGTLRVWHEIATCRSTHLGCGRATYLSITYDPQAAGSLTYLSIKRVLSCHTYIVRKRTKRCRAWAGLL